MQKRYFREWQFYFWGIAIWTVFEEQRTRSTKELRSPKGLLNKDFKKQNLNLVCKEPFRFPQESEQQGNSTVKIQSSAFLHIPDSVHLLRA